MGPEEHGGHCELEFDGLEIPDGDRLLGIGDGLKITQMRLGVARLTHCMRWLGLARRSIEIAMEYVKRRDSFGMKLIDRESATLVITVQGANDAPVVADALQKAVDTSLQLQGARGYSKDTVVEWIYRYARQARLVDGASEVHRMVIANYLKSEGKDFFAWGSSAHG